MAEAYFNPPIRTICSTFAEKSYLLPETVFLCNAGMLLRVASMAGSGLKLVSLMRAQKLDSTRTEISPSRISRRTPVQTAKTGRLLSSSRVIRALQILCFMKNRASSLYLGLPQPVVSRIQPQLLLNQVQSAPRFLFPAVWPLRPLRGRLSTSDLSTKKRLTR